MGFWAAAIPVGLFLLDKMMKGKVSGTDSIAKAQAVSQQGFNNAVDQINKGREEAMGYNKPYMNPEVFQKLSSMVQSGFFQQPFQKSFQAHSFQTPGMQFNPSGGSFGYTPWQPGGPPPSMTPQGLPPMPTFNNPSQMVRAPMPQPQMSSSAPSYDPKAAMLEMSKKAIENSMVQNLPDIWAHVPGGNPANRNQDPFNRLVSTPGNPVTMQDLFAAGPANGGVNRWGSGTFIPKTYAMPNMRRA